MLDAKGVAIDANNMLSRCYHALVHRGNQQVTEGLLAYSFITQLRGLLGRVGTLNPIPFLVWDGANSKKHRLEIHSEYKAGRKSPDPLLHETRMALIDSLGQVSPRLSMLIDDAEADDLIALMTTGSTGIEWVVCTRDADMMQLINDRVLYYNVHTKEMWDRDKFRDKYGFAPHLLGVYKALVGDKSDNWPGVPGIGDKTAKRLIGDDYHTAGIRPMVDRIDQALKTEAKKTAFKNGMRLCALPLVNPVVSGWESQLADMMVAGKTGPWSDVHQRFAIEAGERAKFRLGSFKPGGE